MIFLRDTEKGYFTVEAALVFPMALLFTAMMIFLAFYSYDRCILEQSAYEAALRGTGNHIRSAHIIRHTKRQHVLQKKNFLQCMILDMKCQFLRSL